MDDNDGWTGSRTAGHPGLRPGPGALNLLQTGPKDHTTVTIFNSTVTGGSPWTVDGNDPANLHTLTERIIAIRPDGGTNMYACLVSAATALRDLGTDRKGLVIVMSDGQSERAQAAIAPWPTSSPWAYRSSPSPSATTPTRRSCEEVAEATGGSVLPAGRSGRRAAPGRGVQ